jgi:hypothetical protein
MLPSDNADNIDDLFRQKLDGHATPPAPDLWARLALPTADAEPVDAAFQAGLRGHATPPRRELWERLEDEHLRPQPRRRRVVAWWQLSAAAVLLLMLVGGALWSTRYGQGLKGGQVARRTSSPNRPTSAPTPNLPAPGAASPSSMQPQNPAIAPSQDFAATSPADLSKKNQEISSTQATAPQPLTSSTPMATTTRPRRPATTPRTSSDQPAQRSQPDVAASTLARHGGRNTPTRQAPTTTLPSTTPVPTPAPREDVTPALAVATPAAAPAAAEIIEVEVRRGGARPALAPVAVAVAVANAEPVAPTRRRGLRLGGLLRQADHLVHGELAEATGLPETVTLQARLGGRLVSKTIQL